MIMPSKCDHNLKDRLEEDVTDESSIETESMEPHTIHRLDRPSQCNIFMPNFPAIIAPRTIAIFHSMPPLNS